MKRILPFDTYIPFDVEALYPSSVLLDTCPYRVIDGKKYGLAIYPEIGPHNGSHVINENYEFIEVFTGAIDSFDESDLTEFVKKYESVYQKYFDIFSIGSEIIRESRIKWLYIAALKGTLAKIKAILSEYDLNSHKEIISHLVADLVHFRNLYFPNPPKDNIAGILRLKAKEEKELKEFSKELLSRRKGWQEEIVSITYKFTDKVSFNFKNKEIVGFFLNPIVKELNKLAFEPDIQNDKQSLGHLRDYYYKFTNSLCSSLHLYLANKVPSLSPKGTVISDMECRLIADLLEICLYPIFGKDKKPITNDYEKSVPHIRTCIRRGLPSNKD